jgi:hypothetical protein
MDHIRIFIYFALSFVIQISMYRLSLPIELQQAPILLILDGHKTRLSFEAALIFASYNIEVLILPPHSSHLLQPFDVTIASPLKVEFKKFLDKRLQEIMKVDPHKREKSLLLREIMVKAFLDGLTKAATISNAYSGFRSAGFCPMNPSAPLQSQFAVETPDPAIFSTVSTGKEVGSRILTSPEGLDFLYRANKEGEPTEDDYTINIFSTMERLFNNNFEKGRALTHLPPLLERNMDGTLTEFHFQ